MAHRPADHYFIDAVLVQDGLRIGLAERVNVVLRDDRLALTAAGFRVDLGPRRSGREERGVGGRELVSDTGLASVRPEMAVFQKLANPPASDTSIKLAMLAIFHRAETPSGLLTTLRNDFALSVRAFAFGRLIQLLQTLLLPRLLAFGLGRLALSRVLSQEKLS